MKRKIKLCIAALKIMYHNAVLSLIRVPGAAVYCLFRLHEANTHYIVICDHIGDFMITMGYLEAFKSRTGYKNITLCITKKFENLLAMYPTEKYEYRILPHRDIYRILALGSTNFGAHILKKLGNITLINPADAFVEDAFQYIMRYPFITLRDCIQYGCLNLDQKAYFCVPKVPGKIVAPAIPGFQKGKTVLLSPYSRAIDIQEKQLFSLLAKKLNELGFSVFTNLSDRNHCPISGTKALFCTLDQVIHFVRSGGYVIGVRSGLLDLLAYTKCKMVAIYPYNLESQKFFDLEQLPGTKAEILQVFRTDQSAIDIRKILEFLQGGE